MDWLDADGYWTARWLLERGVALVYLLAFVNILDQWRALVGERGLTPVRELLDADLLARRPTVFRWGHADRAALGLAWLGIVLATLALVGLPQRGPAWVPMATFLALWATYLSFVEVGRVWYAFGWESLLVEAGFLVAFLGPADAAPPWLTLLLVRWLVFRVEFGAGLIKLRGDECWRRLTCLDHHHETQPLPNPLSRTFHHLPRPLHRFEVAANHAAQLVVPFGLFAPQPVAGASGTIIVLTQGYLLLSGNFSWLNLLTIVLAAAAFSDAWLGWLPIAPPAELATPPLWFVVVVVGIAVLVVGLSLRGPVPNLLSHRQAMNTSHDPLRLVNSYGAFGTVTRVRHELIVEATYDDDPTVPAARWEPYGFRAKPGDPHRRPPQVAPYHLRLDWLMWFAAMDPTPTRHRWFQRLLLALLAGEPAVLRLLSHDPGDGRTPTAVRVLRYRYRFTTRPERRVTGAWWVRDRGEVIVGPVVGPGLSDAGT